MNNTVPIQDLIIDIRYGFTGSAKWETNGIGFIRITDIDDNGNVDYNHLPSVEISPNEADRYYLEPGDCVFARSGSVGKVHIYKGPTRKSVFASYLIRAKFDQSKVDPSYFGAFSRSVFYWNQIGRLQRGGVQQNLNTNAIGRIEIPLPPLPIQKQIAAILEKANAAREKRQHVNQLTEQFLQSAFLEMFGDPVTNPKGWETVSLGVVADVKSGFAFKSQDYKENGVRLVRISNFDGSSLEFNDDSIRVPSQFSDDYSEFLLKENDVLIAMSGATTGKLGFVQKRDLPCLLNQRVGRFSITETQRILPQYLFHFLCRPLVKKRIVDLAGGSAQPNVSPNQLKELDIPLPPMSEQHKFATLVEKVEGLRVKQSKSEKELEELFQSLMQRAFKGELVKEHHVTPKILTLHPTDRHAAVLGKIIKAHEANPKHLATLGHVKGEKISHLIEYHVGIDLGRTPVRDAAGPVDYRHLLKVEHRAAAQKWFFTKDRTGAFGKEYRSGKNLQYHFNTLTTELHETEEREIGRIIDLFLPADTEQAEIAATVYAAWNDLLLEGKHPSDAEVVKEARENWTVEKLIIEENRFFKCIEWLRSQNLVPKGTGKHTKRKPRADKGFLQHRLIPDEGNL